MAPLEMTFLDIYSSSSILTEEWKPLTGLEMEETSGLVRQVSHSIDYYSARHMAIVVELQSCM
jgi:hypothetical protein